MACCYWKNTVSMRSLYIFHFVRLQGAFRKVAVEAAACAKELTATLKKRMLLHKEEAAECIQMLRKLGEPVEALQACTLAVCARNIFTCDTSGGCSMHAYVCAAPAAPLTQWRLGVITLLTCR